jgi:Uma2 family endonuclease
MEALSLNVPPAVSLTDEQFYQLCIANEPWQLELTQAGELIICPQQAEKAELEILI